MRPTLSRGLAGAAALATALTVVATASPASATTSLTVDQLDYVALGDSYSAGAGILPPDPYASPLCIRTTKNYPRLIASATPRGPWARCRPRRSSCPRELRSAVGR